jgi:formylmethanofuran dehydrogenase subunit E
MAMRPLHELLKESFSIHGHHCAGQVLGVRMAMAGCREVKIDEPRGCKKLFVYVEIDRCATDAVQTVTGCTLGKRTLKFLDYGKMAATFVNVETEKAVRVLAKDDARLLVPQYSPNMINPREAQKSAYTVMPEDALFTIQPATVHISGENMPGFRGTRVCCARCGEGINFRREVKLHGQTLCIPCAQGRYLPQNHALNVTLLRPKVVLIVGYKKVGKTTLIEKLISELSGRGYRVGTIKHHHSDAPVETDRLGTDSWRHRKAGAIRTALITPKDGAIFFDASEPVSLDRMVDNFTGLDIVLAEGFHREAKPKIEIRSADDDQPLCAQDENLLAVVEKDPSVETVPSFSPGSVKPLADLIERKILNQR